MKTAYKTYMCALFFSTTSASDFFFAPGINIKHLVLKMPTRMCVGLHVKFLYCCLDFNQNQNVSTVVKLSVLKIFGGSQVI